MSETMEDRDGCEDTDEGRKGISKQAIKEKDARLRSGLGWLTSMDFRWLGNEPSGNMTSRATIWHFKKIWTP
jgi:hypothetical protein